MIHTTLCFVSFVWKNRLKLKSFYSRELLSTTTRPFSQFVMIREQINQNQISMNPEQISQAAFVN